VMKFDQRANLDNQILSKKKHPILIPDLLNARISPKDIPYDRKAPRKKSLLELMHGVKPNFALLERRIPFLKYLKREEEIDNKDDEWYYVKQEDKKIWDYTMKRTTNVEYNTTSGERMASYITAHAPETFANLRLRFGISEENFMTSILKAGPFVHFQSNSKGAARVGGVFFFTRDGAYMIKTIKKEEAKTFLEILPKYHKHMLINGRKTLLTRFCGMFTVLSNSNNNIKEQIFVIMNSVFPAESSLFITERYDLKGSKDGRRCTEEEKVRKGSNAVLKDLNLVEETELIRSQDPSPKRSSTGYGFQLGSRRKAVLLSQLRRDVSLLVACKVMDYSLLVGVANTDLRRIDIPSIETMKRSKILENIFSTKPKCRKNKLRKTIYRVLVPLRIMIAPFSYLGKKSIALGHSTLSSILISPFPYHGASICGVDGGALSKMSGEKSGKYCTFYLGLIDFLQPWTKRKVAEKYFKALMGYDIHSISCVDPEEYGSRFLSFIDAHVS